MDAAAADQRALAAQVADWVIDFAGPGYGPGGGSKLVEQADGGYRHVRSAAGALREASIEHPALRPFVELGSAVATHAGDGATLAVLLAAHLVRAAERNAGRGVPIAASLDGYAAALRQARAEVGAIAQPDPDGTALASTVHGRDGWAPLVLKGVRELAAHDGHVALDAVDVRAEAARGLQAHWLDGVAARCQFRPDPLPRGDLRILLLDDGWKPGPWREGLSYRMTAEHDVASWSGAEDARRDAALRHLLTLRVGLVVSAREVDPELAGRLQQRGVLVANDAEQGTVERLARATGARRLARLEHANAADLGLASVAPPPRSAGRLGAQAIVVRGRGQGAGPAATLVVPGATESARQQATEDAERLLRAAGLHLADPVRLPGGGRWQRQVAQRLRAAATHAPGKQAIAVAEVAGALEAVAHTMVRNLGRDPLRDPEVPGAGDVWDVAGCVRVALVAAVEAAIGMLRIDGVYAKAESKSAWLRGSQKMPKGMRELAGDLPPDM